MKTEYKILWIDDQIDKIESYKKRIENFLDNHGIKLIVVPIEPTADSDLQDDEAFLSAISDISLDMVFIDFNMPIHSGDTIINYIRKDLQHYHLPIVFYTSNSNAVDSLQEKITQMNQKGDDALNIVDGIYFSDRLHLFEKAEKILTSLLKKETHPQRVRGLLMDRVSEIDAKIMDSIELVLLKVPQDQQSAVKDTLCNRIDSKLKSAEQLQNELKDLPYGDIAIFLKNNIKTIDTLARTTVLKKILEAIPNFDENSKVLADLCNGKKDSLTTIRNSYAHIKSSDLEKHDDERCKYIRTETRRHLENLDFIKNK